MRQEKKADTPENLWRQSGWSTRLSYPNTDVQPVFLFAMVKGAPQTRTLQHFELFSALQGPRMEGGCVCKGCHNKISQTHGLNNKNLFFSHFWRHGSKIKVSAGLVSFDSSLRGLQTATLLLCPHVVIPLCACTLAASPTPIMAVPWATGTGQWVGLPVEHDLKQGIHNTCKRTLVIPAGNTPSL